MRARGGDLGDSSPSPSVAVHPQVLRAALVTGIALTVAIAASSFWLSFAALQELAAMAGTDPALSWLLPVVIDGAIVATTVIALALSHHTDGQTVRGRKFVLSVLGFAASVSILGNAYHASLTPGAVPTLFAAGIATVAPVFLLGMTEVLAVILRAPRRYEAVEAKPVMELSQANPHASSSAPGAPAAREDCGLAPTVWATVLVYLEHPDWSYGDVASELGVDAAAVSADLAEWFGLQKATAQLCGVRPPPAPLEENYMLDESRGQSVLVEQR
ncbi:hypothetical protein CH275_16640 [Rhodococcus sp. 06-235-1A]|uniref:DUF2637 domain-containing protein n=1 Tax=Rhodococcus sp. 06-235-1A TaxID=2022508 RepID=UPI000B9B7E60|nr:DUF2637 domain-containing protein [Rhodococcus sp. 06-235-1A]OZD03401.1 hypothetical protein CH275_16640 [Rhodococcus sp. 06-235-1A]